MLVAIYSVKGGSGKTTIAVNCAVALGIKHRGEVVLFDLGLPYNHAALVANLAPTTCLALCEKVVDNRFEQAVLDASLHHPSGAMVLPSSLTVEQSELITPQLVKRTLDVLERTFSYVIVDLGIAVSEISLGVLERANRILLIVTPELPSLKDTQQLLEVFEKVLSIKPGNVSLVLNHPRPQSLVVRTHAEGEIGRAMHLEIPYDGPRFDEAALSGEVLVTAAPTSVSAKALKGLATHIIAESKSHQKAG